MSARRYFCIRRTEFSKKKKSTHTHRVYALSNAYYYIPGSNLFYILFPRFPSPALWPFTSLCNCIPSKQIICSGSSNNNNNNNLLEQICGGVQNRRIHRQTHNTCLPDVKSYTRDELYKKLKLLMILLQTYTAFQTAVHDV